MRIYLARGDERRYIPMAEAATMERDMTTLEALISVSETLLRANGRWHSGSAVDVVLGRDIRATVHDVCRLFRADIDINQLSDMAVRELERRAESKAALQ
jgi:hypothetical protein